MDIEDWGLIPYQEALTRQLEKVENVAAGGSDTLIFCSHPPVVTLGRGTQPGDVQSWTGEKIEISRGGRATYHGPSQIVIYPILNLNIKRKTLPERDLHSYLRILEDTIVQTLKEFGLNSEVRSVQSGAEGPSLTGVWVSEPNGTDKKIASIGIAVKKWVTYHGIALNLKRDPTAFVGIRPCGFSTDVMTSVEEQWRNTEGVSKGNGFVMPDRKVIQNVFAELISKAISYQ